MEKPTTLEEALVVIEQLEEKVEQLMELLNLNSNNSSFPPSQKPGKKLKKLGSGRPRGGQKGHKGTHREALPPEEIDEFIDCLPPTHCDCGASLESSAEYLSHQQFSLPKIQLKATEYKRFKAICSRCNKTHIAELPKGVLPGLLNAELVALAGVLATDFKLSKQKLSQLFELCFNFKVAASTFSRQEKYLQESLDLPYAQLKQWFRKQSFQYVDETGFRQGNADGQNPKERKAWLWVQSTERASIFTLALSRGKAVFKTLLGEDFSHTIVSDRYPVYDSLPREQRAVCWVHLKRDFQRISERSGDSSELGEALLSLTKRMFTQRESGTENMTLLQYELIELLEYGSGLGGIGRSEGKRTASTCRRLLDLIPCMWRFLEIEGLEPTNNTAERALRPLLIQRKVLYGTQSERGNRFQERLHTVLATCLLQGRNSVEYCSNALKAHFGLGKLPSLIPQTITP